ncbi:TPA: AAA family ATPase [Bacillus cereus]|nr:AAA family ATPase [Bacillus cereus]
MNIILIGPRGIGKTTVAKILAEKLNKKYISLDAESKNITDIDLRNSPQERFSTTKKVLEENANENCILDFGCFHTFFLDDGNFNEIDKMLAPISNVFLLTPSADIEESMEELKKMNARMIQDETFLNMVCNSNKNILKSRFNEKLAKHIIYTKDMTFAQIAEDIIDKLK